MRLIEPTIPEIQEAPELAPFFNLTASLETAASVIIATYPEIQDLEAAARDGPLPKQIFLAEALLRLINGTEAVIEAYRHVVTKTLGQTPIYDDDPIDF